MHGLIQAFSALGAPVIVGLVVGVGSPILLFTVEFTFEARTKKEAIRNNRKIWWSLTPQRKVRNFKTGAIEPKEEEVDFDPRHGHYMKCGEVVIALASASLVFVPSLHFTAALPWLGLPMVLLGFTVVYALAFMGILTYFYEMQLQNPDTFTATRSCILFSLGFGGLACFAIAYFVLSILIGMGISNGTISGAGH
jgi:hypothetical protein